MIQGRRGAWRGRRGPGWTVPAYVNDSKTLEGRRWPGIRGCHRRVRVGQLQARHRFGTQRNRHHVRTRLARRQFVSGLRGGLNGMISVSAMRLRVLMNRQAMGMFRMGVVAGRVEVQRKCGPRKPDKNKRQSNAQTATHEASVVTNTFGVNV